MKVKLVPIGGAYSSSRKATDKYTKKQVKDQGLATSQYAPQVDTAPGMNPNTINEQMDLRYNEGATKLVEAKESALPPELEEAVLSGVQVEEAAEKNLDGLVNSIQMQEEQTEKEKKQKLLDYLYNKYVLSKDIITKPANLQVGGVETVGSLQEMITSPEAKSPEAKSPEASMDTSISNNQKPFKPMRELREEYFGENTSATTPFKNLDILLRSYRRDF